MNTIRQTTWTIAFSIIMLISGVNQAWAQYQAYGPISLERKHAMTLYSRLTGVKVSIDAQIVRDMQALIEAGDRAGAAQLAMQQPQFINTVVRQMAQRMSTRETTFSAPLTDMVATIMGIVNDERSYKEILTGDYYYRINLPNAPSNEVEDILQSNDHYEFAEEQIVLNPNLDVAAVLERFPQSIANDNDNAVAHPEPSGVITSRAFLECALDGTNRRCYEETVKKFACTRMEDISNTSLPEDRIRIDLTRTPGGDPILFENTCKGCHTHMDAMTGAFAYIKLKDDQVIHSSVNNDNIFDNEGVDEAFNRGADTGYEFGYETTDNTWFNYNVFGSQGQFWGWRDDNNQSISSVTGSAGIPAYGKMIANSQAFSRCMVQHVYNSVCGRRATAAESSLVVDAAAELENPGVGNGSLKWLYARVASDRACLGY